MSVLVILECLSRIRRKERKTTLGLAKELPVDGAGSSPPANLFSFDQSLGHSILV